MPKKQNVHTEKACEFIRYRILSGSYPPGFRLKTLDLASESGMSRTPVREALLQLQQEGLVDIRPRQGARVRTITFSEFKEMSELRLAMESFAAELAAQNRGPEDLVEMEDAMQRMERLLPKLEQKPNDESLVQELAQQDIHFHSAILNAAGNSLLRGEVFRFHLFNKLVNVNLPRIVGGDYDYRDSDAALNERRRFVFECHRAIFQAIISRQPEAARKAMYDHLKEIIDRSIVRMARRERAQTVAAAPSSNILHATV
jgi:DNA-binding GntR family transcriptional regulator